MQTYQHFFQSGEEDIFLQTEKSDMKEKFLPLKKMHIIQNANNAIQLTASLLIIEFALINFIFSY